MCRCRPNVRTPCCGSAACHAGVGECPWCIPVRPIALSAFEELQRAHTDISNRCEELARENKRLREWLTMIAQYPTLHPGWQSMAVDALGGKEP